MPRFNFNYYILNAFNWSFWILSSILCSISNGYIPGLGCLSFAIISSLSVSNPFWASWKSFKVVFTGITFPCLFLTYLSVLGGLKNLCFSSVPFLTELRTGIYLGDVNFVREWILFCELS